MNEITEALNRGCITTLCTLNLSKNKFKNIDKFVQFVKNSQALNVLHFKIFFIDINLEGKKKEKERKKYFKNKIK